MFTPQSPKLFLKTLSTFEDFFSLFDSILNENSFIYIAQNHNKVVSRNLSRSTIHSIIKFITLNLNFKSLYVCVNIYIFSPYLFDQLFLRMRKMIKIIKIKTFHRLLLRYVIIMKLLFPTLCCSWNTA